MAYTTIDNPELFFQVKIWTGTGSSQALTLDGDENMQPDYVAIKERSGTQQWNVYDSIRGVQKYLGWNTTGQEATQSQGLTAFGSDGFTVGTDDMVNGNTKTYAGICWVESATSGFDIVTFTGNQTARTISHSLSAKPEWLWIKNREKVESWHMQHGALGATQTAETNTANAFGSGSTIWNDTEPTTSVFSVGNNGNINETDSGIVVYLWSGIKGFSKFGKYEGNNNADGPYVFTGFRPAWVMIKRAGGANGWFLSDTKRVGYNGVATNSAAVGNPELSPNLDRTEAEGNTNWVDIYSNGFKPRITGNDTNGASETYVYMAFAHQPMVNSDGIHSNAR